MDKEEVRRIRAQLKVLADEAKAQESATAAMAAAAAAAVSAAAAPRTTTAVLASPATGEPSGAPATEVERARDELDQDDDYPASLGVVQHRSPTPSAHSSELSHDDDFAFLGGAQPQAAAPSGGGAAE